MKASGRPRRKGWRKRLREWLTKPPSTAQCWSNVFTLAWAGYVIVSAYTYHVPLRLRLGVTAFSLVLVILILKDWWLWWRKRYPDGAWFIVRYWGKTGSIPFGLPEQAVEENVWPPPPKQTP